MVVPGREDGVVYLAVIVKLAKGQLWLGRGVPVQLVGVGLVAA